MHRTEGLSAADGARRRATPSSTRLRAAPPPGWTVERPAPDVLVLRRDGRSALVVRPSGTEPKLKAYLEVVEPVDDDLAAARARADDRMDGCAQRSPACSSDGRGTRQAASRSGKVVRHALPRPWPPRRAAVIGGLACAAVPRPKVHDAACGRGCSSAPADPFRAAGWPR